MKTNSAIKDDRNRPTLYFLSGEMISVTDVIEIPGLLLRMNKKQNKARATFKLAAVTEDFVYYIDEDEMDDTAFTVMLNREMELVSDNFFASDDLTGVVADNTGLIWMSGTVMYWQREQHVRPDLMTAEINKKLESVDITNLTDEERKIYFAFLDNGPVRYTKPEALMAVISNDIDLELSDQLAAINHMLQKD